MPSRPVEMRLSEFVIIYLAAAAPFGVAHILTLRRPKATLAHACARAALAALVWPVWLGLRLIRGAGSMDERIERSFALDAALVERAKRETICALRLAEDALCADGLSADEEVRRQFFAAREYAERYAGLALACDGAHEDETPSEREMELCRITGRSGDDLLLAGRCLHRRNVTRLLAHRERARAEFEAALAKVCAMLSEPARRNAVQSSAVALCSALGDDGAASRASRLRAATREGQTKPEASITLQTDASPAGPTKGGRSCTTPAAHTAFANPPRSITTSTRG